MKLTPIELGRNIIKDFQAPPHILEFQSLYNDLHYRWRFNRLAVVCPVRHGKTWFWAWLGISTYLMNHPTRNVAYISYGDLADEYGWKIRSTLLDYSHFTGSKIDRQSSSKTSFRMEAGGSLVCKSAGNPVSGFGYDWIIVDDVQKKQDDVDSEHLREKMWRYFYSDLINRLKPNGKITAIMARRHPDDLMGRLKEHSALSDLPEAKRWFFKTYRALNGGEALWPSLWSKDALLDIEKDYELAGNSYLFQCLYQGDALTSPSGLEWSGELFDGITYDEIPACVKIVSRVVALDPSKGKNTRSGDFAAMVHMLISDTGDIYVDDCRLVRLPGPQLEDQFIVWMENHPHDASGIESDMDGGSMCEMIGRKLMAKDRLDLVNKLYSVPSKGLGDKAERLRRDLSRPLARKKLKIREIGHYKLLISQFRNFSTHGRDHDDGPDSVSLALRTAVWITTKGKH